MRWLFVLALAAGVWAQTRMDYPIVAQDGGHVALGLALRKLSVSGTFMQAPAHPDDETNALLAYFARGMGLRTIDLQNNRGDGGQNEIGPELFRDMAVLRTAELLAAHRLDGAEQYFTRAIDFGYSFDPRRSDRQVGPEGHCRRLRATDPHAAAGCGDHHEHPGPRRRPGARSDDAAGARGVSGGRRSVDVPGADPRGAAAVAGEEAVLQLRLRRDAECGAGRYARRSWRRWT